LLPLDVSDFWPTPSLEFTPLLLLPFMLPVALRVPAAVLSVFIVSLTAVFCVVSVSVSARFSGEEQDAITTVATAIINILLFIHLYVKLTVPHSVVPLLMVLNALPDRLQNGHIQFTSLAFAVRVIFFIELNGSDGFPLHKNLVACIPKWFDVKKFALIAIRNFYSELFHT
jgi:hypothetical protein